MTDPHSIARPEPQLGTERPFYYGWVIVPIAALMIVGTLPGQTVVVSQFNISLRSSLGLTSDALAFAYLVGTLAAALPLTLVGRLSDGIGPRRTSALVVAGFCLGVLWLSNATGLISLTIGFFLIRFLGQGALGLLSSHVVALWFERRLATVESIKGCVFSLSGALVPGVVLVLIEGFGWRQAYAIMGIAVAVVLLPLIAFVLRDQPDEVGQHLDNEPPDDHAHWHDAHERAVVPAIEVAFTLSQAMRTRSLWLLLLPGVLSGLVGTALLFHIQPLLLESGLPHPIEAGTLAVSSWSIATFVGLLTGGPMADRLAPRVILPVAAMGVGLTSLMIWAASEPWHAAAAMGVFGVTQGWGMATAGPAIARFYGRPHHGAIRGFKTTAMVAGTATGPFLLTQLGAWIGGSSAELIGDPTAAGQLRPGLPIFAVIAVPIAIGAAFATRPRPPESEKPAHHLE